MLDYPWMMLKMNIQQGMITGLIGKNGAAEKCPDFPSPPEPGKISAVLNGINFINGQKMVYICGFPTF